MAWRILGMVLALLRLAAGGEELLSTENPDGWSGMVETADDFSEPGKRCYILYGKYATKLRSDFVPVTVDARYRVSCELRSLTAEPPASANFGVEMYDDGRRLLSMRRVCPIADTQTELAAPAAVGSTELLIRANPTWLEHRKCLVVFGARADYADLPNFDCAPGVGTFVQEGDTFRYTLPKPLARAWPAGTAVRLHVPYEAPLYSLADGWMPAQWTPFFASFQGQTDRGMSNCMFSPGTRYVRIFVWFGNWNRKPEPAARLLVRSLKLTRLPAPAATQGD